MARIQKRFSGNEIKLTLDLSPVLDVIAAGGAMANLVAQRGQNMQYLDNVVDVAFEQADDAFKTETDAYAMSTGEFGHMYEWGTVGINKGRTNVRQSPNAPNAKLWHTFTQGKGMERAIAFVYKPSMANVPKPTKAATGMDADVIASMRDHVFTWKAKIIEEAPVVTIRPKEADFLLIPAYEENRPYMRPHDIKRGYMLTKGPIQARPGSGMESFTEWWFGFWLARGDDIVQASVQSQLLSDTEPEFRPKRTGKMMPIGNFNLMKEIAVKQKAVEKRMQAKARLRALRETSDDD